MPEVAPALIPMLDLSPEIDALRDELHAAVDRVLTSGQFILGPEVAAFEQEFADDIGVRHAIGVNSGTDALVIGLRALGIGPGDEVITTPFTFVATAEAIAVAGATPVFADILPDTFNIDPAAVEAAITERTRAIIPVHLFGQSADMPPLLELAAKHDCLILEDVAQAVGGTYQGRKLGSIGNAATFSFFPSKNLGALGDAGLITTNDDTVAEQARMLRAHGSKRKYFNELHGYNSRLDAIQAAMLRVKLPHLESWNTQRQQVAETYNRLLADVDGITAPPVSPDATHVYHQYTVRVTGTDRDSLQSRLKSAGISSAIYYPVPLHQLPLYESAAATTYPHSEAAAAEVLSLPISPSLDKPTIERIVNEIRSAIGQT